MARIREESCLETKSSSLRGHPSAIIRDSDDLSDDFKGDGLFPPVSAPESALPALPVSVLEPV